MIVEQQPNPISAKEALAQIGFLRDLVEETRMRAADAYRSYLIFGVAWVIGYVVTALAENDVRSLPDLDSTHVAVTWLTVLVLATGATFVLEGRAHAGTPLPVLGRRLFAMNGVLFTAGWLLPTFLGQTDGFGASAYWPFLVGVIYVVNGIFLGGELIAIGCWLIAASVISLFLPTSVQALWLAFAGGGGLIATGVIFRRRSRERA